MDQPDIRPVKESGKIYVLQADYDCKGFTVPAGYQHDGASVPRFAWTLTGLLPDGIHRPAALIHDYLYWMGGLASRYGYPFSYSRKTADNIFREILNDLKLKKWHVAVLYWGVRIGGGSSWKKK